VSAVDNRAVALRFVEEVFNQRNLDALAEIVAPDVVAHIPGYEPLRGLEAVHQWAASYLAAFDSHLTVEDVVAEGDKVVLRFTVRATHRGEYLGVPPTGRQVTFPEISLTRYAEGKAREFWLMLDSLGVMQQLGMYPKGRPPRALLWLVIRLQRLGRRRPVEEPQR
jgi:predicted ester cyclase